MAEQMGWQVVQGRKQATRVDSLTAAAEVVREGTTGRLISTLSRVWAVAGESSAEVASEQMGVVQGTDRRDLPKGELAFYRKYTEALLRRYVQMTMEAGRVPSMLGRSVLGGRASSYRIHGFDDAVNFRLDVEKCLHRLEPEEREILRRVAMQEYTQAEAAGLMGICLRTCVQRYGRALDKLTGILLEVRLLEPFKELSSGRR
ncbi:MAG: sigma factor-like helix-turn-helix DNA-binding protein [Janthinobacterium lividum]